MENHLKRKRTNENDKTQHCERLRRLLTHFLHQHNWKDASAVLSVLIHATTTETSTASNRNKYVAAMELLKRDTIKHITVKHIFELWYTKIGPMKNSPKEKYQVLLEFVIFCLSQNKLVEANISITSMTQDAEYGSDPMLNLIAGLVHYQLWYSIIPEEMKLKGSEVHGISILRDLSEFVSYDLNESTHLPMFSNESSIGDMPQETDFYAADSYSEDDMQSLAQHETDFYAADSFSEDDMQSLAQHNRDMQSESSCQDFYVPDSIESSYQDLGHENLYVADSFESSARDGLNDENDVEFSSRDDTLSSTRIAKDPHDVSLGDTKKEPSNQVFQPRNFYCAYSEEMSGDSEAYHDKRDCIFSFLGCDVSLLPLRLPKLNENFGKSISTYMGTLNDNYSKGVKHLRVALYSTPPIMASLLPLVQLLLLGDQVEEAMKELENICKTSDSVSPLRIRAKLLECVDCHNCITLSACYEQILNRDPACSHSIGRLIIMYEKGYYDGLPLLEMVALHLDVTKGTHAVWKALASCFLKLPLDEDGKDFPLKKELWKCRCRWYWPEKHFDSCTISEQGDLRLLTTKAACASYLYGPACKYTVTALDLLRKEKTKNLICDLELHMERSVNVSKRI